MLDGGFLEPRVAALENKMSLMGSDLHAVQIAGVSAGGMIDSLSPATYKSQDIYGSGGGGSEPVAWTVAKRSKETSSGTAEQWQIFAPTWTVGRETLLPEGMKEDWNDLDIHSGDLYAVLTWTGTATTDDAGEVKTTWTPGKPTITNDLSSIPADEDPTPDDPSTSTIEGKEGHRSIVVKIGTFITEDPDPENPDAEPEVIGFLQIHTGSIIEDLNTSGAATAAEEPIDNPASFEIRAFEEEQEDGTKKKVWKYWAISAVFAQYYPSKEIWSYPKSSVTLGWKNLNIEPRKNARVYALISWKGTVITKNGIPYVQWERDHFGLVDSPPEELVNVEPTRYTEGRRTVLIQVGMWAGSKMTWNQFHVGTMIEPFPIEELYSEEVQIPVAFEITDSGMLAVSMRKMKIPQNYSVYDKKILLDLPGGGSSDQLGPIEWDASRNSYVQFLGKWTYNGSSWVFAKKMNGNTAYPPAAIYPVTEANILARTNRYGSPDAAGDNIAVIPFKLPFAAATATNWLTKQESTVSTGVVYTPPETVDGSGSLDSKTFTITYWSDTGETNPQTANLLGSIVEGANESSTYEG